MTTQQKPTNSILLSGLTRQYKVLKQKTYAAAENQDLINLLTLLGTGKPLPERLDSLVRTLLVASITEELAKRKKRGTFGAAPLPTRPVTSEE
jgi:hypothetical protein